LRVRRLSELQTVGQVNTVSQLVAPAQVPLQHNAPALAAARQSVSVKLLGLQQSHQVRLRFPHGGENRRCERRPVPPEHQLVTVEGNDASLPPQLVQQLGGGHTRSSHGAGSSPVTEPSEPSSCLH
jgi:hypothetical protein